MDYIEIIEKVRAKTEEMVSKSRYEHCVRVAEMCSRLCRYFNLDQDKGYLIGIGHDICKELPAEEMIFWAKKDGLPITDFERNKVSYLHGRASAMYMKEVFGVSDEAVIEAIAYHINGKIDMNDFTKCVYIADKSEPGRAHSTDEYREKLYKMSLNEMVYFVMKRSNDYIVKKGYELYPETEAILEYTRKLVEERSEK